MLDLKDLADTISDQMNRKSVKADEIAAIAHMNVKTWYRTMKNPEMFRLGDLLRICRYLGIRVTAATK